MAAKRVHAQKSDDAGHARRQVNLVFARSSPALRALEDAERITGESPTKIVRSLIDSRLAEWLQEEVARRQRVEEATRRAHALDIGVSVQYLGKQRPRYRATDDLTSDYAEIVMQRAPLMPKTSVVYTDLPVTHAPLRLRSQPLSEPNADDDDVERA